MGLILLGAGILIFVGIAAYAMKSKDDLPATPTASPFKFIFGAAGLAAWGAAAYLFYNVWNAETGWYAFSYVVFAGVLFGSGIALFSAASKADQKRADNTTARATTQEANTRREIATINLESARDTAKKELRLVDERRKTEEARLERERKEEQLKQDYISEARQKGLDIDSYIRLKMAEAQAAINFDDHVRREQVRIQTEAILIQQQLDAATQIERSRRLAELRSQLSELRIEYRNIEINQPDRKLRKQLLADKDEEIKETRVEIDRLKKYDGQANRFFLPPNRQETNRIG